MEMIELRIIATVVSFLVFLGILAWAYAGNQRSRFARDAQIIFEEDEAPVVERVVPFRRGSGHGLRTDIGRHAEGKETPLAARTGEARR